MKTWAYGSKHYPCPIVLALDRLAGKWKTNILWHVHNGTRRFNAICRALPSVNRGVILRQLRALERDGLLARRDLTAGRVRHVEYCFTPQAEALSPAILALAEWGNRFGQPVAG
ncbi:MAG: helix-turn-helix transcriptional regulator [Planctomycetes bacterium]|nr:helix-turn-helix transcriptional regulator [Planctomycetota bacterium]